MMSTASEGTSILPSQRFLSSTSAAAFQHLIAGEWPRDAGLSSAPTRTATSRQRAAIEGHAKRSEFDDAAVSGAS
jgi:hypothetical protein